MATTPNYTWPTPNDTDQLADGAAAIRALGDAVDTTVFAQSTAIAANGSAITTLQSDVADKLPLAGGTVTGNIVAQNVSLEVDAAGSDTINLDFSTDGFVTRNVSGTAITVTGSAYSAGATKTLRLVGGTAVASLDVPADWVFVGSAAGTALGTAVTAVISATAFGTAESDVVAAFAEEA
jgi:hypothetical protein